MPKSLSLTQPATLRAPYTEGTFQKVMAPRSFKPEMRVIKTTLPESTTIRIAKDRAALVEMGDVVFA